MDLNNIELSASAIAGLYSSTLIGSCEISEAKKSEKASIKSERELTIEPQWKSLGDNKKNILVIVQSIDAVHIPDDELRFLTGILGACKLTIADVAIVNLKNNADADYKDLTSFFKSKIVFLFNVEPAIFGLPMSFPFYQIQAFAGNSFLYCPSLKELEKDKVEKTKLWMSLKRLFNL